MQPPNVLSAAFLGIGDSAAVVDGEGRVVLASSLWGSARIGENYSSVLAAAGDGLAYNILDVLQGRSEYFEASRHDRAKRACKMWARAIYPSARERLVLVFVYYQKTGKGKKRGQSPPASDPSALSIRSMDKMVEMLGSVQQSLDNILGMAQIASAGAMDPTSEVCLGRIVDSVRALQTSLVKKLLAYNHSPSRVQDHGQQVRKDHVMPFQPVLQDLRDPLRGRIGNVRPPILPFTGEYTTVH